MVPVVKGALGVPNGLIARPQPTAASSWSTRSRSADRDRVVHDGDVIDLVATISCLVATP
jgi:hypothetical protein